MNRRYSPWILTLLTMAVVGLVGCDDDKKTTQPDDDLPAGVVPDFSLEDVNPNSPSFGDSLSPRDFLGQVSCWYFGHST